MATDFYGNFPGPEGRFDTFTLPDPPDPICPNQQFRADLPSAPPPSRLPRLRDGLPAREGGGDIVTWGGEVNLQDTYLGAFQASPDGEKLTYSSLQRFAGPEGAPWTSQYLATREAGGGWGNENLNAPRQTPSFFPVVINGPSQSQPFTEDLCTSFLLQDNDRALAPGDQVGYPDLYKRSNCGAGAGAFELLTIRAPETLEPGIVDLRYEPRVKGFSADGSLAVFRANERLTADASTARAINGDGFEGPAFQLYIHNGTTLRLVSVLPSPDGRTPGAAADRSSSVGNFNSQNEHNHHTWRDTLTNAVSEAGDRVYWETLDRTGSGEEHKLYVRVNPTIAQSPVSGGACTRPERACTYPVSETVDAGKAEFEAASPDGNRALFSFSSGTHSGELYLYELTKAMAGQDPETLIAPGLQEAILGASEDLTRVYFVSRSVLDAGAVAGRRNLYLHTVGEGTRLIATLADSNLDGFSFARTSARHISRVSPDAAHAAFVSTAPLTGYDNTHTPSDSPAAEVFLYDAEAGGGAGELLCVSCNPSGGRPAGTFSLSPSEEIAALLPRYPSDSHISRPLSADGSRLFFDSYDALLPADTNGAKDIYMWQAPGSGECDLSDANHFEANGGCLALISTGTDPQPSTFIDASADGSDVFFSTGERLHGADVDELIDIYDARIGGGFPAPAAQQVPCEGEECRGPASSPADVPGAGSRELVGAGNPPWVFPRRCPKGKRKVVRKGKTRCVPKKAKKRGRANHNRRATR